MTEKKIYIVIVVAILGIFIVVQGRWFTGENGVFSRDTQSNVFQEITILKNKNQDLKNEIENLDSVLQQLRDQNSALEAIEEEVEKYKKLNGEFPIFGPGVSLTIDIQLTTPWVIDLINEFFNSGVQAVSINGIRITNNTAGFDTLPQGQILLNGSILSSPYIFDVIGEPSLVIDILELPGGILDRLEKAFSEIEIDTTTKEIIRMDKI